jgi:hypothetical protein
LQNHFPGLNKAKTEEDSGLFQFHQSNVVISYNIKTNTDNHIKIRSPKQCYCYTPTEYMLFIMLRITNAKKHFSDSFVLIGHKTT